jgi:hypothetical protein
MMYEVKFGLIGFVVGTVAISATTFASNVVAKPASVAAAQAPAAQLALLPMAMPMPAVVAKAAAVRTPAPARPMSAWRRAYIARHGHPPPVPAS